MCEIIVTDASTAAENARDMVESIFNTIYVTNNDGLGVLAVYIENEDDEDGEDPRFSYNGFKGAGSAQRQNFDDFVEFVERNKNAWRFIFHARLATAGGIGFDQTHPIKIVDDDVDADFVVHNGVVRGDTRKRKHLQRDDHEFNTEVDTEVIAHKYKDIPEDLDNLDSKNLRGSLNWILVSPHGILVHNEKYALTKDFRMTCRSGLKSDINSDEDTLGSGYALFKPNRTYQTKESTTGYKSRSSKWSTRSNTSSTNSTTTTTTTTSSTRTSTSTNQSANSSTTIAKATVMSHRTGQGYSISQGRSDNEEYRIGVMYAGTYSSCDSDKCIKFNVKRKGAYGNGDNYDTPVPLARVVVHEQKAGDEYEHTGVYYTGPDGILYMPEPEKGVKIVGTLQKVPELESGKTPDYSDKMEGYDDEDREPFTFSREKAKDVKWWYPYEVSSGDGADGFCGVHNAEYHGTICSDCVVEFDREELLNSDWDDIELTNQLEDDDSDDEDSDSTEQTVQRI